MSPRIDPDSFGFVVTDIARMIRAEMDRRIVEAGLGITPGESRTLSHAARAGTVRQNVLAERMGVEAMTVTTYLDRLEALDLVERLPDAADRRAKLVRLTPAGEDMLDRIKPISNALLAEFSKGFEPSEWDQLRIMMKTVRANIIAARAENAARESAAA